MKTNFVQDSPFMFARVISIYLATSIILAPTPLLAKNDYGYPELLVVPRASETLKEAAQEEQRRRWYLHSYYQIPALFNLWAGLRANKEDELDPTTAGQMAMGIGSAWLIATGALVAWYKPYTSSYQELKRLPRNSKRKELARQRRAEEGLELPALIAKRMGYLSLATNFVAAVAVSATCNHDSTRAVAVLGATSSLLPLLLDHPWVYTYERHQEYKKKIYGPLASWGIGVDRSKQNAAPYISLSWLF